MPRVLSANQMCAPPGVRVFNGGSSSSHWISRTVGGPHCQLTTGAAALAASTLRPPLSRSAAAAAAVIPPASLPSAPRNPRTAVLAPRKICSMIAIKVRMKSSP